MIKSPLPDRKQKRRLLLLILFIFTLFSLLIFQYYRIQIIEGEKWVQQAKKQHFFLIQEPFQRGTFYSNNTVKTSHPEKVQKLVFDIRRYHLYVDPLSIPLSQREQIQDNLLALMDLDKQQAETLKAQFEKKSRSRKLAMWLDRKTKDRILEWWKPHAKKCKLPSNALYFVNDYQRSYPFGSLLGQVLHAVQSNRDETTKQAIPTGGLELSFDSYLRGKTGKKRLMRSPHHAFETGEIIEEPRDGCDIYLTVNHCLQAIVEEELAKGAIACKAKAGSAIIMNPYNGHILAFAQYPYFHAQDYARYFNDPQLIEHSKVKSITDANEPGSVMKAVTAAVALQANKHLLKQGKRELFSPEEKIRCDNNIFPGRKKPLKDTTLHHWLNMNMALQKSSNVYMARLIERVIEQLGNEWYRKALIETFGFGTKTGVELPAESSGVVPAIGKKHPNGKLEWSQATPFSLAMGHNIQVTGIQLVRAYAVIANGGHLVQPTLIRKIVRKDRNGKEEVLVDHTTDEWLKKNTVKVLDKDICERVATGMKYVTKWGGTSWRGDILGYTEAGKSSTAEKIINGAYSEKLHTSSFIGFTPIKGTAFVMLVTMDEPEYGFVPGIGKKHHGGFCCAPVFKQAAKRCLEYLGIAPDDPYGYPVGDPRYDPIKADWKKETKELQELYEKWNI